MKGLWAQAEPGALPDGDRAAWPNAYFWMAAASRHGAPDRYYVALKSARYNAVPPTGPFWDPVKKQPLELANGRRANRAADFALVFRTADFAGRAGILSPL